MRARGLRGLAVAGLAAILSAAGGARADADITVTFGSSGVRLTLTAPTQPDPINHPGVYETTISLSSTNPTPNLIAFDLAISGTSNGANGQVVQEGRKITITATKFTARNYITDTYNDVGYNSLLDSYWFLPPWFSYADPGTGYLGPDGWDAGTDMSLTSGGIKGPPEMYPPSNLSESVRFKSLSDYRYSLAFAPGDVSTPYPIQDWGPVLHLAFTGPSINLHLQTLSAPSVVAGEGDYLLTIPEPVTLSLLGAGAAGLLRRRRRWGLRGQRE